MIRPLTIFLACTTIVLACGAAYAQAPDATPDKLRGGNFVMPIRDEQGRKDMLITGKSANKSGGYITLQDARITLYRYDSNNEDENQIWIFSPAATYDDTKRIAGSGKPVKIHMVPTRKPGESDTLAGQAVITGVGFDLTMQNIEIPQSQQILTIRSAVQVRLYRDAKLKTGESPEGTPIIESVINETVITSESMTYNMDQQEIVFVKNVKCVDKRHGVDDSTSFTLNADKMTVFLQREENAENVPGPKTNDKNAFDRITALDHIRLVTYQDEKQGTATGNRCEYRVEKDATGAKTTVMTISQSPILIMSGTELLHAEEVIYRASEDKGNRDGKFYTEGGRPILKIDKGGEGNAFGKILTPPKPKN